MQTLYKNINVETILIGSRFIFLYPGNKIKPTKQKNSHNRSEEPESYQMAVVPELEGEIDLPKKPKKLVKRKQFEAQKKVRETSEKAKLALKKSTKPKDQPKPTQPETKHEALAAKMELSEELKLKIQKEIEKKLKDIKNLIVTNLEGYGKGVESAFFTVVPAARLVRHFWKKGETIELKDQLEKILTSRMNMEGLSVKKFPELYLAYLKELKTIVTKFFELPKNFNYEKIIALKQTLGELKAKYKGLMHNVIDLA